MTTKEMFKNENWVYDDSIPNFHFTSYSKKDSFYIIVLNEKTYKIYPVSFQNNIYCMVELLFKYKLPIDIPKAISIISDTLRENLILNIQKRKI